MRHYIYLFISGLALATALQQVSIAQTTATGTSSTLSTTQTNQNDYHITKIRFFPRAGHAAEMVGGQFIGSITSATNDFEGIVPIEKAPVEN